MEVQASDVKDVFGEEAAENEPPTLEKVEELARLLPQYNSGQSASGEAFALQGDIELIETNLDKLKVESAPSDLPGEVKEAWKLVEGKWACQATIEEFKSSLELLCEPLLKDAACMELLEEELDLEQLRIETLQMLTDLLDELVEAQPSDDDHNDFVKAGDSEMS
jgi:hypothetical protein